MKLDRITASMIRDYQTCPRLFLYRHVMRLRLAEKPLPLLFGTAVHKGAEVFHNTKDTSKALAAAGDKLLIEEFPKEERKNYSDHYIEAMRLVQAYIDGQDYLREVHGVPDKGTSEKYFKLPIINPRTGEKLDITMNGVIDRIAKPILFDIKTSSKPYKQADADTTVQPTVYTKAYRSLTGKMPEKFLYVVLIKGRKDPLQVVETKRNVHHLIHLHSMIENIKSGVENDNFERGNGFFHKWCDCYKYEDLLNV